MSLDIIQNNFQNSSFTDISGNQYIYYPQATAPCDRWVIACWLSDLDFKETQKDIFANHTSGTGQWLLNSLEFNEWLSGQSNILWCPGDPGSGKTILTSIVTNHLWTACRSDTIAVACIYCNYKEQSKQTIYELIASVLKQLVQDQPATSDYVKNLYKEYHGNRKTRPRLTDLLEVLRLEIGTYSQVYILVDALDEYPEYDRDGFIATLQSLADNVNLMVTFRPLPSIEQQFNVAKYLRISAMNEDVQKYIQTRIPREVRLARHVKKDPTLQDTIVNKIVGNVRGMFLLAKLHIDSLISKTNLRAVRDALEQLPTGINATYNDAIARIRQQNKDDRMLAEHILKWVTCARRPLTQEELQHALAVTAEMTDMDHAALVDEVILIEVCAGLVVFDENRGIIRLVHYTTQEYFEAQRDILFPSAQADIAITCLRYLSFDECGKDFGESGIWSLIRSNPLVRYAAENWGHHAYGQAEEACREAALQFLGKSPNVAHASEFFPGWRISAIHYLASFGLEKMIHDLLQTGVEVNLQDDLRRTPLLWAAENGHEDVVGLFLARDDVKVDSRDHLGRTPLSWAAQKGHEGVVKLLLPRDDVEVNLKDNRGRTPLSWAAKRGNEGVVKLFLARDDAEVNSKDNDGRTPLSWAAENGHEGVVRLFLARDDVKVSSKDIRGWTPLSCAADNGHEGVVRLFLAQDDIEVDLKDGRGRTSLSWAAARGNEGVVRLFLARNGVEINEDDDDGRTPLLCAAINGHEGVVKLFLARDDIEVNSKDNGGQTPLSWAARRGHEGVVKLFLARDEVQVNSKDNGGQTPLSWAAENGHEGVLRLFLARDDVKADLKDIRRRTPLSWAAGNGYESIVRLLLTRDDVKVDSKDIHRRTPLSWAAENGHGGVVRLLLARNDVEVHSKDNDGRTPLLWVIENRRREVVTLLQSHNHPQY